jgi:SAM-dependent methyltransferase
VIIVADSGADPAAGGRAHPGQYPGTGLDCQREDHDHGPAGEPEIVRDQAFWDERYQSASTLWSGKPNSQLVTEAAALPPGTAFDAGCGEGADAIWLARRGWRVTAADLSPVALQRAADQARRLGADVAGRITWQHADLTAWAPPAGAYDLVSAQYLHFPRSVREPLQRRLADAVAPGGTLLIVGHDPSDIDSGVHRPDPELLFTAEQVAACLEPGQWQIIAAQARPRQTTGPDDQVITIHDAVLLATRRSAIPS